MVVSCKVLSIQLCKACSNTMAKAGKVREERRTRRGMAKSVSHGHHTYTHMGIKVRCVQPHPYHM